MVVNRTGITRTVWVFRYFVVKFPNWRYSWHHFLKGVLANIKENQTWKFTKNELLCPVMWCSWGGWVLIMKRADVKSFENYVRALPDNSEETYKKWIDAGFGGDDKCDNYGYIKGKLVKIDYA